MAPLQCSRLAYFLRWRILARIRRFLRPTFRRPLPVFFVPNLFSKTMKFKRPETPHPRYGLELSSLTVYVASRQAAAKAKTAPFFGKRKPSFTPA